MGSGDVGGAMKRVGWRKCVAGLGRVTVSSAVGRVQQAS